MNTFNRVTLLRTSREFPENLRQLTIEVNRSYLDTANAVNIRTVGIFTVNRSNINGERWYITQNTRQQGIRQVYKWDDTHLTIAHGINLNSLTNFIRIWGTFFDGTNWQTLPYVDVAAVNNQINVMVDATNIVITKGGGVPNCTNGLVILEWISNP